MNFFSENRTIKILIIIAIVSLPIFLSIGFGKIKLGSIFTKTSTQPTPTPAAVAPSKIYLYCPSVADFCTKGIPIQQNKKNLGFGGKLPAGTPALAAFNGRVIGGTTVISSKTGKETINTITLIDATSNTTAIYYFKGDTLVNTGSVKVGTKLATITQNITTYNTSLLFQLYTGSPADTAPQLLKPNSFLIAK